MHFLFFSITAFCLIQMFQIPEIHAILLYELPRGPALPPALARRLYLLFMMNALLDYLPLSFHRSCAWSPHSRGAASRLESLHAAKFVLTLPSRTGVEISTREPQWACLDSNLHFYCPPTRAQPLLRDIRTLEGCKFRVRIKHTQVWVWETVLLQPGFCFWFLSLVSVLLPQRWRSALLACRIFCVCLGGEIRMVGQGTMEIWSHPE